MSVDIDLGPVSDLSPSTVVPPGYYVLVRLGPGWRKPSTPSAASSLSSQSPHPASATLSSCPSHPSLPPISAHPILSALYPLERPSSFKCLPVLSSCLSSNSSSRLYLFPVVPVHVLLVPFQYLPGAIVPSFQCKSTISVH